MTARGLAFATLTLLASGCIFGTCKPSGPPPPDECSSDTSGDVSSIAIGPGTGEDQPFVAWSDGDAIEPVYGSQGAAMFTLRIRVSGTMPPQCLAQTTTVSTAATLLATDTTSVNTYADGGARTTKTLFIVPSDFPTLGTPLTITTKAGGVTVTRMLFAEFAPADLSATRDLSVASDDLAKPKDLTTTD